MCFYVRAELLIRREALPTTILLASKWLCSQGTMDFSYMSSELVMLSESLRTTLFGAL